MITMLHLWSCRTTPGHPRHAIQCEIPKFLTFIVTPAASHSMFEAECSAKNEIRVMNAQAMEI